MTRRSHLAATALALSLLLSGSAMAQAPASTAAPSTLVVTFTGLASDQGSLMVAVFDGEAAYKGGAPVRSAQVKAAVPQVAATFEGLPPGRYAIKSFHDLDGDGKMGTNPFGIPTEPYAFSNNAPARMGPPSWADAAFSVDAGGAAQSITIK